MNHLIYTRDPCIRIDISKTSLMLRATIIWILENDSKPALEFGKGNVSKIQKWFKKNACERA